MKRTSTVPTHLRHEDQILSLGFMSLNARQLLLLIIAASFCYELASSWLLWLDVTFVGLLAHYLLVALLALVSAVLIFGNAQGRGYDLWLLIILGYAFSARRYSWQSMRVTALESEVHPRSPAKGFRKARLRDEEEE